MLHSMGKNCCWRSLKISSWLVFFCIQITQAQSWEEVQRRSFDSEIIAISLDFQKNVFISMADGQLLKLDDSGNLLASFSQPNLAPYTSLEMQNSLNPFCFARDNQQVVFLDRFLANPVVYDLSQWTSSFVWLATPSIDRQLWLLESDPFRITKIDRFTGNVLHEIYMQIGLEIEDLVYFSARQQNLILVDQYKGIYMFDLFGNLVKHVAENGVTFVQLIDDELFYYLETSLIQYDLKSGAKLEIPVPGICSNVIRNGDTFLCVSNDQVVWWRQSDQ